uniref:Uncharacterized protein n=1 Tax=Arundo donax TaxID=35708 RepID=A0A0A9D4U8_ARUDO
MRERGDDNLVLEVLERKGRSRCSKNHKLKNRNSKNEELEERQWRKGRFRKEMLPRGWHRR